MMRQQLIHYCLFSLTLLLASAKLHADLNFPDPTRPGSFVSQVATVAMPLAEQFKLHSVLISSQRRVAIINKKSVEVGDNVNGATVRQIDKSRVELVKHGTHFSLSLVDHDFKQRK